MRPPASAWASAAHCRCGRVLFKLINDYFDGTTIADLMASSQDGDNYII